MINVNGIFIYFKYKILSNFIFSKILDVIYNEIDNLDLLYNTFRRLKNEAFNDYKIFSKEYFKFRYERKDIINTFINEKREIKRIAYQNILNNYFCYDILNIIIDYIV